MNCSVLNLLFNKLLSTLIKYFDAEMRLKVRAHEEIEAACTLSEKAVQFIGAPCVVTTHNTNHSFLVSMFCTAITVNKQHRVTGIEVVSSLHVELYMKVNEAGFSSKGNESGLWTGPIRVRK